MADVNMFLTVNGKYFPAEKMMWIKERLSQLSDEKVSDLSLLEFNDPMILLMVSLFLGSLGVDRFMLGDTGMGVLKLLTLGGCGFVTIYDWFTIMKKTKEKNMSKLAQFIQY